MTDYYARRRNIDVANSLKNVYKNISTLVEKAFKFRRSTSIQRGIDVDIR